MKTVAERTKGFTFIGVDLAWRSEVNHSGIAVARGDEGGAVWETRSEGITSLKQVADFVLQHSTGNTVVAIDAPLIVNNLSGQRPCETEIGRRFGRFDASCHTSNLTLYPDPASVRLVRVLEEAGFSHAPDLKGAKMRRGCWLFEVYPHPAQVVLFRLERIIKYKRGKVREKRAELRRLQAYLRALHCGDPPLFATPEMEGLLHLDVDELAGVRMKHYEDTLDGLFCCYLAFYYWRWGGLRNEMIGDLKMGYIIIPTNSPVPK